MIYKKILLKDYFPCLKSKASLTSYCISNHEEYPYDVKRKTILVIPGGGYEFVSKREAEPIAIKFLAHNFNVFVLDYTVGRFKFPYPINEAFAAMAYIREHAEEYNVDLDHVGVCGFSAGGHLAASISNYFKEEQYQKMLNVKEEDLRIDFSILVYPVLTTDRVKGHSGTAERITQDRKDLEEYFDIVNHISPYFPPTYMWSTKEDIDVPPECSQIFKKNLDSLHIKNEYHLFPKGRHGGATCDELTTDPEEVERIIEASAWIDQASKFINSLK